MSKQPDIVDQVICGDSAEVLKTLEPECIDLMVTSPPYDNLRKYHGYTFDFETIARQLHRVTKPGGVVVWVVGDATIDGSETLTSFKQALYFQSIGFNVHDTMIYKRWSGPMNHNRYEQEFEYMFVLSKGILKTFNPIMVPCKWYGKDADRTGQVYSKHDEIMRKLRSGKARNNINPNRMLGNVWEIPNASQGGEGRGHPAPFPEILAQKHIESWSSPGDTILDCFAGSGTTLKMAKELGRHYIGIELSAEYCEKIIRPRLLATNPALFA